MGPRLESEKHIVYCVRGQWYTTSRLSFCASGWQTNDRHFRDGDEVAVYYCPSDPSMAVLRPGLPPSLLLGPLFFVAGVVLLIETLLSGDIL